VKASCRDEDIFPQSGRQIPTRETRSNIGATSIHTIFPETGAFRRELADGTIDAKRWETPVTRLVPALRATRIDPMTALRTE
jgi:hypothetical protein